MESCEGCGFTWDAVEAAEIPDRVRAGCRAITVLLLDDPARAGRRPEPGRWSMLEYAGHVRDVLLNLRDRIVLGVVEDNPVPKPMHADARVDLGLYAGDGTDTLAAELVMAGDLFARTVGRLAPEHLGRPIFYGYPAPATRTVRWVAAQALHEVEHHAADVAEDARLLG